MRLHLLQVQKLEIHDLEHPNRLQYFAYEQYIFTASLLTFFFSHKHI